MFQKFFKKNLNEVIRALARKDCFYRAIKKAAKSDLFQKYVAKSVLF